MDELLAQEPPSSQGTDPVHPAGRARRERVMRRELTAQVGADGVLTLSVVLDPEDANKAVRVVGETVEKAGGAAMSQEEWKRFVERTAGSWQGEFVREPEGE